MIQVGYTSSSLQSSSSFQSSSLESEFIANKFEILKFRNLDTGPDTTNLSALSSHNFSVSNSCTMEADCEERSPNSSSTANTNGVDLMQVLSVLSNQISTLDRSIQAQLWENESKMFQ
jgi:hypothetical protein